MDEGALVLVDCLGFRGIWNRVEPQQLIGRLQAMETEATKRVIPGYSSTMLSFGPVRFHLRLLSDTVALSVQYEPRPPDVPNQAQQNLLVSIACESASVLATLFIDHDIPLPLRGCISFGHHLCEGNFLIGPAVDEAAEYMNEPEGAFIWVLPGAAERNNAFLNRSLGLIERQPKETLSNAMALAAKRGADEAAKIIEHPESGTDAFIQAMRETYAQFLQAPIVIQGYPMPIRRGGFIDAAVINPLFSARTDAERRIIIARYDQFMRGNRIDIWTKHQNTLKFLAIADQATAKWQSTLGIGE
jgi:hypothetical protein